MPNGRKLTDISNFVAMLPRMAVLAYHLICVGLGGAIGSMLRYLMVQITMRLHPEPFPLGTMMVNIIGSFVIGFLMAKLLQHDSEATRLFVITGMLGGFTTFSAFSWDALSMYQRGELQHVAVYILGSVVLSLMAVLVGFAVGK